MLTQLWWDSSCYFHLASNLKEWKETFLLSFFDTIQLLQLIDKLSQSDQKQRPIISREQTDWKSFSRTNCGTRPLQIHCLHFNSFLNFAEIFNSSTNPTMKILFSVHHYNCEVRPEVNAPPPGAPAHSLTGHTRAAPQPALCAGLVTRAGQILTPGGPLLVG